MSILKKVPKAFSRNLNMKRKIRKRLRIIKRSLPILMRKVICKSKTAINKKRTKRRRRTKILRSQM